MNIELKFPENLTDDEMTTIEELAKKASVKKSVFKPVRGTWYFYISAGGDINKAYWKDDDMDKSTYALGNYFAKKAEAEFAIEKQKVLIGLKRYALDHNECEINLGNFNQPKYCIYYNWVIAQIEISSYYGESDIGQIYFTSREIAKNAIEEIGADRIKKYLFGAK